MRQGFYKVVFHHIFLGIAAMLMIRQTLVMSGVVIFYSYKYLIVVLSTIVVYQLAVSGVRFPFKPNHIHRNKSWIAGMLMLLITLVILIVKTLSLAEEILLLCVLIESRC